MLSHATASAGRGRLDGDPRLSMEKAALWAAGAPVGDALGFNVWRRRAGDIATVALFLQLSFNLPRGDALGLAASGVSARRMLKPASAMKNRPEARAVLEFGLDPFTPGFIFLGQQPLDLLRWVPAA